MRMLTLQPNRLNLAGAWPHNDGVGRLLMRYIPSPVHSFVGGTM